MMTLEIFEFRLEQKPGIAPRKAPFHVSHPLLTACVGDCVSSWVRRGHEQCEFVQVTLSDFDPLAARLWGLRAF